MGILIITITIITIVLYIQIETYKQKTKEIRQKEIKEKNEYKKKNYLLTQTELKFYKVLKEITDELNLVICPQVAMYEVINTTNQSTFNKISRKSVDFTICRQNLEIICCIELDDYTHNRTKRIKRDIFVNKIFADANQKLLRIQVRNIYNKQELKGKLINCLGGTVPPPQIEKKEV